MNPRRNLIAAMMGLPFATVAQSVINKEIPPSSEMAASIISYTLYAEARGESFDGKLAVASVIHTRGELWQLSFPKVCQMPRQFSCWNSLQSVPASYRSGHDLMPMDARARGECYRVAWLLMTDGYEWDYFTHFYNPALSDPYWAADLLNVQLIGHHQFGYLPN